MDVERNKANVRRVFEEGFNEGRLEVVDECVALDALDRHDFDAAAPDFPSHLKGLIAMLRAAMPDLHTSVEDLIGEDDRVAARVIMTGTHTGEALLGVTATGRSLRVEQFHVVHCDDHGLGIAHWAAVGDVFGQLGVPEPASV